METVAARWVLDALPAGHDPGADALAVADVAGSSGWLPGGGRSPASAFGQDLRPRPAAPRALVVPQKPEAPAQATKPAGCEANCAHHRPVRLSWARRHGSWGWAAPGVWVSDGIGLMTRAKSQTTPKRDGFRLRCQLGRECSAQEKADVLAWLLTHKP